jgi:hypothetical protein
MAAVVAMAAVVMAGRMKKTKMPYQPIMALWAIAKAGFATTLPMPDWMAAAALPGSMLVRC